MPVAELHFFHADDPNGSTIFECSTDDEWVKGVHLNIERDSLGGGTVTFARKVPAGGLFQREIIEPEVLVRVLLPAISETKYYHGFFINPRQQQVISKAEQGGEGFIFGGPGPKHYLERMLLWSASFAGYDNAVDRESGVWTWPASARAGAILARLFIEDAANPNGPFLPALTKSFSDTNDSDSVAWADDISAGDDDFSLRIQDNYLKIMWILEDLSGMVTDIDLGVVGAPLLQLNAYQTYGEDLTADILFEEGVNIAADLDVEGSSYAKASHALVRGSDGAFELAVRPGWSAGDLRKVVPTAWDTSNNVQLDNAGQRYLTRQQNGEKQIKLHIIPGTTALAGEYFPGPPGTGSDFWTGDTVSLTTGMGSPTELDYDDEPQAVTGIELELTDAVRDDTTLMAARSWDVQLFLNEERKSSNSSRDLAGSRGTVQPASSILKLCRASTFTDPEPAAFIGALGAACSQDDTAFPSEYPPWVAIGANEEFVDITSAEDVPIGGTILVGVSTNKDGVNFSRPRIVYDEKGNTYTLDAEGPVQGTSDVITQVWRSVLTTAIVTGDYIRFATQIAGGDSSGRCIAVAAWDNSLTSPDVVTANGASATPSIGSTPVADITFFSMACFDETVVGDDADWEDTDAYVTTVTGSGANASGLLTQYLQPGDGQGWTSSGIDQPRSFSLAVVGYVSGGTEGGGSVNDGNADLVGTSARAARCDHRHDVHRDVAPTVDDDFATAGYKLGTIWAQLDDLDAPTEIVAVWMAADVSTGAAIWLEWPGGSSIADITDLPTAETDVDLVLHPDGAGGVEWGPDDSGSGGATYFSRRILAIASNTTAAAIDINSTTYVAVFSSTFYHDWDEFPATHFQISAAAQSNAAAQTITAQLTLFASPTNPVSAAGNDVVITNTFGVFSSGWVAVSDSMSGLQQMVIAFKGSSATVDLTARWLDIAFKM